MWAVCVYRELRLSTYPTPCRHVGCPHITREDYCPTHASLHNARERARLVARPSSTARGYGAEWRRIRDAHLAAEPLCRGCGQPATMVDHITPKRFGGTNHPSNLQSLCQSCHASKSRKEQARDRAVMR